MGAAVSTILSYGLLAAVAGRVSQRWYPVPWELGRVLAILVLGMALSALALLGPDHVAWRIGCIVAYPVIAIGLRILPAGVLRTLTDLVRRR
jgi:hypothetical protein